MRVHLEDVQRSRFRVFAQIDSAIADAAHGNVGIPAGGLDARRLRGADARILPEILAFGERRFFFVELPEPIERQNLLRRRQTAVEDALDRRIHSAMPRIVVIADDERRILATGHELFGDEAAGREIPAAIAVGQNLHALRQLFGRVHDVVYADAEAACRDGRLDDQRFPWTHEGGVPIRLLRVDDRPRRVRHAGIVEGALHVDLRGRQIVEGAIGARVGQGRAFECVDHRETRHALQFVAVAEIDHAGDAGLHHLPYRRFDRGDRDRLPMPRDPKRAKGASKLLAPLFEITVVLQLLIVARHHWHKDPDEGR